MKKLFLALAIVLASIAANAQQPYTKAKREAKTATPASRWKNYARSQYWGIRLGANFADGNFHHGDMNCIKTSSHTGFSLAVLYGKQIASPDVPLFIETGLHYSQKGFSSEFDYTETNTEHYRYSHNLNYLEIPVHIKYKINTGVDDFTIQPFIGGFFDFGLSSRTLRYEPERTKLSSFGDDFFDRLDAGLRFGCGVAYQNFYFELYYDWGMANICSDNMKGSSRSSYRYPMYTGFDETGHNSCFSMSIGIDF